MVKNMNFIKTDIDGVVIVEPRVFSDARGYFFESYNAEEFEKNGIPNVFVQDNQSMPQRFPCVSAALLRF